VVLSLGICVGALLLRDRWNGWWQIDACLDSGGAWSYERNRCERAPETEGDRETRMDWMDPLDPVVVTVDEVASGAKPALLVMHDEGHGGWQILDGDDVAARSPVVVPKDRILAVDPTLREVTDLPVGWQATRKSARDRWMRSRTE
jgi:hypothetical protein